MALASSQQSFLTNFLISTQKPKLKNINSSSTTLLVSCKSPSMNNNHHDPSRKEDMGLGKLVVITLVAGALTFGSVHDAMAGKSGGRIGGQAFRSSSPRPSSPRQSSPRINNSRTNIYINPRVAPPLVGGYGYGYGVPFYGGWGWSPFSFFAPGPSAAIGFGGGFEVIALFMFLGAISAVVRRFTRSRNDEEDDDYYN